mmetsp:Transcript_22711/g.31134  ORF Transcript_22711/g.31134 Transcript_22711/m.31134 type:complete len:202 (+) Transcript_22711:249-854(+)
MHSVVGHRHHGRKVRRLPIQEVVIIDQVTIEVAALHELRLLSRSLLIVLLLRLHAVVSHCAIFVLRHLISVMAARDRVIFYTSGAAVSCEGTVVESVGLGHHCWLQIHLLLACGVVSIALLSSCWLLVAVAGGRIGTGIDCIITAVVAGTRLTYVTPLMRQHERLLWDGVHLTELEALTCLTVHLLLEIRRREAALLQLSS